MKEVTLDGTHGLVGDEIDEQIVQLDEATGIPKLVPGPIFPILPLLMRASGLYSFSPVLPPIPVGPKRIPVPERIPIPIPGPDPGPLGPRRAADAEELSLEEAGIGFPLTRESIRLDVDGRYPQMTVSGSVSRTFFSNIHWIAKLTVSGTNQYTGTIWFKDGDSGTFPYTTVQVHVAKSFFPEQRSVTITFTGGGAAPRTRTYKFQSPFFHPVDFEFDCVQGVTPTISFDIGSHPNRPASLAVETITLQEVYRRAGFNVTTSAPGGAVPLSGAGANSQWSDMEMHDAMQTYWSRFASHAQWAMWVLTANQHEQGSNLGGVMFDDIGPQHRQGTAVFNNSFISTQPAGDPNPAAFVQRMRFWTTAHEMGHAFNLAHSWQKALSFDGKGPWIPLTNDPNARSFMNYPYKVPGSTTAFFSDFAYRFTDQELLFLRHAPARFVQMGNAAWFDHHGFEQANVSPEPTFTLAVRVNRDRAEFEFLEVITAELKLTNTSAQPQVVDKNILELDDDITVIIKKDGAEARQLMPYARYCLAPESVVLMPGESLYAPITLSAGRNGWDIATPGVYSVQVSLSLASGEDIVSEALRVRVAPPQGYDDEYVAQELFSEDVGRTLAFGGTRFLQSANDALQTVIERLPDRKIAVQANLAMGNAMATEYKALVGDPGDPARPLAIKVQEAQPKAAKVLLMQALTAEPEKAVETLGHIRFKESVDRLSAWLDDQGAGAEAAKQQDTLLRTLSGRTVHGRPVLGSVLDEVKATRDAYKGKK